MTTLSRRTALAVLAALPAAASSPATRAATVPEPHMIKSFDGAMIAVRTAGRGRPTILLHGFLSSADSWFRTGLADRLAVQGRRVIAIDFRGHGASDKPTDPAAYPKDALARDVQAVIKAEGASDLDIVGYSMGALVTVRLLTRGVKAGRVVLGGMGDARVMGVTSRDRMFMDGARNGSKATVEGAPRIAAAIATGGMNGPSIVGVLNSLGRATPAELKALTTPILIVCGDQDHENGEAEGLAAALGDARALRVPGNHGGVPATAPFMDAVTGYLGKPA